MRKGMWIGLLATVVAAAVVWGASEGCKDADGPTPIDAAADECVEVQAPLYQPTANAVAQATPRHPAMARTEPSPNPFGPDPNDFFAAPQPSPIAMPSFSAPAPDDAPVDASSVDPAPLRSRLLAEVARKAELMSVEQLQQEIEREAATIRELQAARELGRARQVLDALTKSHPETKAGKAAENMLRSGPAAEDFHPTSTGDAPLFRPRANDPFTPKAAAPVRSRG